MSTREDGGTWGLCLTPLVAFVLLFERVVAENMFLVILLDQIIDDGTRLPQREACIGVLDGLDQLETRLNFAVTPYVPGTRPFGLMSMNGFFLISSNLNDLIS